MRKKDDIWNDCSIFWVKGRNIADEDIAKDVSPWREEEKTHTTFKNPHSQLAKVIKIFVRILYFIRFILSMYFCWSLKIVKAIMRKFLREHSRIPSKVI